MSRLRGASSRCESVADVVAKVRAQIWDLELVGVPNLGAPFSNLGKSYVGMHAGITTNCGWMNWPSKWIDMHENKCSATVDIKAGFCNVITSIPSPIVAHMN